MSTTTATSMTHSSTLSFPRLVWDLYVEYLWNYDPKSSWVATIAYAYRVFAIFLITPFALLVLTVSALPQVVVGERRRSGKLDGDLVLFAAVPRRFYAPPTIQLLARFMSLILKYSH